MIKSLTITSLFLLLSQEKVLSAKVCPYLEEGTPPSNNDSSIPDPDTYNTKLLDLDINDVFNDIDKLLTDSQECWPADMFNGKSNYGPLMIRLTWHCSGSFRNTDGAGGCAGGRIRYTPEASWDDNTNLDKARALLGPIKEKYGDKLSWGDLFVFAGTAAILNMGGPVSEVCAGRIDSTDNTLSLPLDNRTQCVDSSGNDIQGNCPEPLGASTVGLIYVNPVGIEGNPDPEPSAARIREIFGRMGMNDTETVALIGGGHAFGKAHGACPDGAGPNPEEQPLNPWPGNCGTDFPDDTFTSGLEGQWTTYPFQWDNEYFTQLRDDGLNYTLIMGDGDAYQWENPNNGYMMLTTDLALIYDDDYYEIVEEFADDINVLNAAFSAAWKKLTEQGGTWAANRKCIDATTIVIETSMAPDSMDMMSSTMDSMDDMMSTMDKMEPEGVNTLSIVSAFGVVLAVLQFV